MLDGNNSAFEIKSGAFVRAKFKPRYVNWLTLFSIASWLSPPLSALCNDNSNRGSWLG